MSRAISGRNDFGAEWQLVETLSGHLLKIELPPVPLTREIDGIGTYSENTSEKNLRQAKQKLNHLWAYAEEKYGNDPLFQQFKRKAFSPRTQQKYDYGKVLEILLTRKTPYLEPQDLVDIRLLTRELINYMEEKRFFSDERKIFFRENLLRFVNHDDPETLFKTSSLIPDEYIRLGIVRTYMQSKGFDIKLKPNQNLDSALDSNLDLNIDKRERAKAKRFLKRMLEIREFFYYKDKGGLTYYAARYGNVAHLEELVKKGISINGAKEEIMGGALHGAAMDPEVNDAKLDFLFNPQQGADLCEKDSLNATPLHVAASRGNAKMVERYIQAMKEKRPLDFCWLMKQESAYGGVLHCALRSSKRDQMVELFSKTLSSKEWGELLSSNNTFRKILESGDPEVIDCLKRKATPEYLKELAQSAENNGAVPSKSGTRTGGENRRSRGRS